jgi:hypothetical protein
MGKIVLGLFPAKGRDGGQVCKMNGKPVAISIATRQTIKKTVVFYVTRCSLKCYKRVAENATIFGGLSENENDLHYDRRLENALEQQNV